MTPTELAQRIAEFLRPSGAGSWTRCAAYITACLESPEVPETPDDIKVREEGLACHWLAEQLLAKPPLHDQYFTVGKDPHPMAELLRGDKRAPNGVSIDHDMVRHANDYAARIIAAANGCALYVEQSVPCDVIYEGMTGSPDTWFFNGVLDIWDLKYGYVIVEAFRNLQLSIYALSVGKNLPDETPVRLNIYQPRAIANDGPLRSWNTTLGWLRQNMLGMLRMAAVKAASLSRETTAGIHCKDCPARFHCTTYIDLVSQVCTLTGSYVKMDQSNASMGAQLKLLRDAMKLLEKREEALTAQVTALVKSNQNVPGWGLRHSTGRESYQPGMERTFIGVAKIYGVDVTRPITPAEARKTKIPSAMIDAFTQRPKSGMALAYIGPNQAAKEFSK